MRNERRYADACDRLADGVTDNIQVYNIPKFDGFHQRQHPPVLQENIQEIEEFSRVSTNPSPAVNGLQY